MPLSTYSLKSLTLPEVLERAAVAMLKVVDLPAPLGPSNPNIYFGLTVKVLLRTAMYPFPYILVKFVI